MVISFPFSFAFCFSLFPQLFVRPPQTTNLPFCISFSWGWFWSPPPVQCYELLSIVLQAVFLLLPSCFSRVRLCATPSTEAHQIPPSLGFSRQEHWSGLPFPSPMHESESEVTQSCSTLRDPMDCSLPGSSIHGIFQARVLEWVAISFSNSLSTRSNPLSLLSPLLYSHKGFDLGHT